MKRALELASVFAEGDAPALDIPKKGDRVDVVDYDTEEIMRFTIVKRFAPNSSKVVLMPIKGKREIHCDLNDVLWRSVGTKGESPTTAWQEPENAGKVLQRARKIKQIRQSAAHEVLVSPNPKRTNIKSDVIEKSTHTKRHGAPNAQLKDLEGNDIMVLRSRAIEKVIRAKKYSSRKSKTSKVVSSAKSKQKALPVASGRVQKRGAKRRPTLRTSHSS